MVSCVGDVAGISGKLSHCRCRNLNYYYNPKLVKIQNVILVIVNILTTIMFKAVSITCVCVWNRVIKMFHCQICAFCFLLVYQFSNSSCDYIFVLEIKFWQRMLASIKRHWSDLE